MEADRLLSIVRSSPQHSQSVFPAGGHSTEGAEAKTIALAESPELESYGQEGLEATHCGTELASLTLQMPLSLVPFLTHSMSSSTV